MSEKQKQESDDWVPLHAQKDDEAFLPYVGYEEDKHEGGFELVPSPNFSTRVGPLAKLFFQFQLAVEPKSEWVRQQLQKERITGAGFLWSPVFLGIGCIVYFNLPREPLVFAFPILALVCWAGARALSAGNSARSILLAITLLACGASISQVRTMALDTTMLSRPMIVSLSGTIEKVERRADGRVRYTIHPDITDGARGKLPLGFDSLVRVTARKNGPDLQTGQRIIGRARLAAPSGPSYPGGYSFAFQSWFNGIGASGFFLGAPKRYGASEPAFWSINSMRESVVEIIRSALPDGSGGLAAALIVGDRSGIEEETAEALRLSGLAHILAISGLHMALLSATVIALFRVVFAFNPKMALARPVKKWAAGAALGAATLYLVLSGASVATQRAWIMVSIMLIAVLLDQRALTMRNVAIAALVVLILSPEAILLPGFQMSFAAVAALIATYGYLSERSRKAIKTEKRTKSWLERFVVRDVGGLALTSLIAGTATALFAAYHFHRVATFGLLANLMAMPLVSIVVMPLALISALAMPFGLEAYPLTLMAYGIDGIVEIARWVSQNGPQGMTGRLPVSMLVFATIGLLLLCLLKTPLRLVGIGFFALAAFSFTSLKKPDVLILENAQQIGVFAAHDDVTHLELPRPRAEKFSTDIWTRAYPVSSKGQGRFICDSGGCSISYKGAVISHIRQRNGVGDDCWVADVIVTAFNAERLCDGVPEQQRPIILDQTTLRQSGSQALHIVPSTEGGNQKPAVMIERSIKTHPRPWTRHRFSSGN